MSESARKSDVNGWIEIEGNPITKVGVFQYSGAQIDPIGEFGLERDKIYNVYRPEEELTDPECIESFKLVPFTDDHPTHLLGKEIDGFVPAERKGVIGTVGESIYFEDGYLKANLKIFSDRVSIKVNNDEKKELSAGYRCVYDVTRGNFKGTPYEIVQRKIRGNHVALVHEGRAGPDVAVLDKFTFALDTRGFEIMNPEKEQASTPEQTTDQPEITLDMVMAAVAKLTEAVASLSKKEDAEVAAAAGDSEEETPVADAEGEGEKTPVADKNAMDAKKLKAAFDKALDAANKRIEQLENGGIKRFVKSLKERDELAKRLSDVVGVFDHSEMTIDEVATYGAKELEKRGLLKCEPGLERATLNGFLHAKKSSVAVIAAQDAAATSAFNSNDFYGEGK